MARAATESEKAAAIRKGLAYLYNTQQPAGYWRFSGDEQAATGAAAFAFLSQKDKWDSNAAIYQAAVDKAIAFLLSTAKTINVSTRSDGVYICHSGIATCTGVYWFGNTKSTYTTGLVAPAIALYGATVGADAVATTSGPLVGMTWREIAQGITNAFAASQSTTGNGNRNGGWSYSIPGNGDSDTSSTQGAVVSFLYNEVLGAVTPEAVKTDLRIWLGNVQNASGAVCYQPGTEPCGHADTGGWLLAMKFVGYGLTNSQVQAALSFLNTYWKSPATNLLEGNFGHPYAMWAVYQGVETTIGRNDTTYISNFLTGCSATTNELRGDASGGVPCVWSEDYSQWLVKNQKDDGGWGGYLYWTDPLAAAFYVNILGATHIPVMANQPSKSSPLPTAQIRRPNARATTVQTSSAAVDSTTTSVQLAQSTVNSTKIRPRIRKGVIALAVDAGGDDLASVGTDKKIRIWDATTGQQRLTLTLPSALGSPTGLAFTGGFRTLSSVGRDSLVRVWDAVSGSELAKLAGHEHAIRAVAASPNAAFLASGGEETRIMLWDLTSRKLNTILFGPKDFVNALSFSPDSRLLASADENARVLIFDIAAGKSLHTLRGHVGPLDAVAFSPNGTVLASGGQDTVIHVWDPANGQQRQALRGHSAPIRTITFSPDGGLIASGGEDTRILLWNATTGVLDKVLTGSTGAINVLVFDPRGRFLASADEAGKITLWNVITGVKLRTITVPGAP